MGCGGRTLLFCFSVGKTNCVRGIGGGRGVLRATNDMMVISPEEEARGRRREEKVVY